MTSVSINDMRKKLISVRNKSITASTFILFLIFTLQLTRAQTFYQYKEVGPYEGDAEGDYLVYNDEIIVPPNGIAIYKYRFPDIAMVPGYLRHATVGIVSSNILTVILTNSSGHDEFQINRDVDDINPVNLLDFADTPQSPSYYEVQASYSDGYVPQTIYNIIINNDSIDSDCDISLSRWVSFDEGVPVEISPYHFVILGCSFIALVSFIYWVYRKKKNLRNEKEKQP
ncbi:MAG: hypothetical protein ACFE9J_13895 [Candidatus Hermodarchaeota archaeon]